MVLALTVRDIGSRLTERLAPPPSFSPSPFPHRNHSAPVVPRPTPVRCGAVVNTVDRAAQRPARPSRCLTYCAPPASPPGLPMDRKWQPLHRPAPAPAPDPAPAMALILSDNVLLLLLPHERRPLGRRLVSRPRSPPPPPPPIRPSLDLLVEVICSADNRFQQRLAVQPTLTTAHFTQPESVAVRPARTHTVAMRAPFKSSRARRALWPCALRSALCALRIVGSSAYWQCPCAEAQCPAVSGAAPRRPVRLQQNNASPD